ncbi:CocE/NonD family hydrolase [Salsipaludibacter albus]|uniref:CocE/NonD family hydrolase n=1 Tax=Salsipaludibacter albus TaxID=2849650 RepID=UPI001EE41A04|nr:CocE/NonD family hydrolase [Salsipaludibacter albus]MBY5161351.1 CocE/NonD family hydrolase [Salsipaludibacter albus]
MHVADLPHAVRTLDPCWIPMTDGTRLAATVWLPEGAGHEPVPAILEYIPYRRGDFTAARDARNHPYFAGHGYASVRVDMRGSGDSEGVLRDEYLPQEQLDGLDVLAWMAAQPWCDGRIGMIGISWGGFNGLQIAAHQPDHLRAVVSVASTDDRYADDVHHMGGCLLGDNLSWASVMFAYNSLPPDPRVVGDSWRDTWLERLEANEPWLATWLRHQRRDAYWRHGSISDDYASVQCPVMLVSGWADGYSNAVFRMLANLDVPRRGLVGPWSHRYPHMGIPGPAIGFLQECVRWWDRWLKGIDNGVDDEPMLRAWMQDSVPPTASYRHRPGRWVAEPSWPSDRITMVRRPLGNGRLEPRDRVEEDDVALTIQSPLGVGSFAGKWCSYGAAPDLAHDQRQEDGGALVFDSDPLAEPVEVLGAPTVRLRLAADQPTAMVAVRLSDVAPDGAATRVTYGLLNLTHRDGGRHPQHLEPGRVVTVDVRLNEIAQRFPAGHRLRVAVSTSYWPLAWTPPAPVRLTVHTSGSHLVLPERPPRDDDVALRDLGEPEGAPPLDTTVLAPEEREWLVSRNLATDVSTLTVVDDRGTTRIDDHGLTMRGETREWYSHRGNDVLSVRGETRSERELTRPGWRVRTVTRTVMTSDATSFRVQADLDAWEDDRRVHCRTWDTRIPRDFV